MVPLAQASIEVPAISKSRRLAERPVEEL